LWRLLIDLAMFIRKLDYKVKIYVYNGLAQPKTVGKALVLPYKENLLGGPTALQCSHLHLENVGAAANLPSPLIRIDMLRGRTRFVAGNISMWTHHGAPPQRVPSPSSVSRMRLGNGWPTWPDLICQL
jgi:hypothetical protein